jgi:hypothetical protein
MMFKLLIVAICFVVWFISYVIGRRLPNLKVGKYFFHDITDPVKWFYVVYAWLLEKLIPPHILEQMIIRLYEPDCFKMVPDPKDKTQMIKVSCRENGECFYCGCDMNKVYVPYDSCSEGNWGSMIFNKKAYAEWRKKYPIKLKVDIEYGS